MSSPNFPEPHSIASTVDATDPEKSQQGSLFVPYPNYTQLSVSEHPVIHEQPRRVSFTRRLFRSILHTVALVAIITFFFTLIVNKAFRFAQSIGGKYIDGGVYETYEDMSDCVRFADWTTNDLGEYYSSYSGDTPYPYVAKTSVDLPISSDLLYLFSRGHFSNGVVEVTADGDSDSNVAAIEVKFLYHHAEILDKAHVCLSQREEGENGVGIFTPKDWHHHPHGHRHSPFFAVKVTLPAPAGKEPLQIKGFETELPGFLHAVDDLEDLVDFKTFKLRASNHPIYVKSVFSGAGDVETSNGPIYGNFTTSGSLILRSSNSPIIVNITLINDNATDHVTEAELRSSNGHIVSNLTLVSKSTDDHTGGKFKVTARSSNSPLDITFVNASVDSVLEFQGHTSNSLVRATAPSTYEGSFFLRTSTSFPVIDHDDTVTIPDPIGKGRTRDVEVKKVNRGVSEGMVRWLPAEPRELGSFELTTSNFPVILQL